jgi:hypothetical protein
LGRCSIILIDQCGNPESSPDSLFAYVQKTVRLVGRWSLEFSTQWGWVETPKWSRHRGGRGRARDNKQLEHATFKGTRDACCCRQHDVGHSGPCVGGFGPQHHGMCVVCKTKRGATGVRASRQPAVKSAECSFWHPAALEPHTMAKIARICETKWRRRLTIVASVNNTNHDAVNGNANLKSKYIQCVCVLTLAQENAANV